MLKQWNVWAKKPVFASQLCRATAPIRRLNSTVAAKQSNDEDLTDTALKNDSEIGEDSDTLNTGVIVKEKQESLMYFDHLYPYKAHKFDIKQYLAMFFLPVTENATKKAVEELVSGSSTGTQYKITSVQPMRRDGGAFVKFQIPWNESVQEFNKSLLQNVNEHLSSGFLRVLFAPRCFPVKGKPWIEDLRRFPSRKVKVSFQGPDLAQEELYLLFRRYGIIEDIVPPKPDSKDVPRSATVFFRLTRGAITLKNCLNGYKLNETKLHVQFVPERKESWLLNLVVNHQRISIPLLLLLVTLLLFVIFEPIREFFVKEKITQRYSVKNSIYYKKVMAWTNSTTNKFRNLIYHGHDEKSRGKGSLLWLERYEKVKELKLWLEENVNTFIVIRGPRGSGKHDMVIEHLLRDRANVMVVDCDPLIKARNERKLILSLALQIGYFPSFPWLNSFTSFVDLGLQGLIGQKSGISESKEQQVKTMLGTLFLAIRDLSLEEYSPFEQTGDGDTDAEDDDSKFMKEEDFLQQHPECKPVVVIDRYQPSRKLGEPNAFVYKELADWAANLVSMNVAHVVFITDDIGSQSQLSESLPNQVFKTATLSDASEESAKNYVLGQLQGMTSSQPVLDSLDEIIKPIGGRMLDLQLLARRLKSGEPPKEAINEMIVQTSEQLTQIYFNKPHDSFTPAQVWAVVRKLADHDEVSFREMSMHPLFKANPKEVLSLLESTELITLLKDRGLIKAIRPGKPLFKASFENLVHDERIFKDLEIKYNLEMIGFENKRISKWVDEINKFGEFSDLSSNKMFRPRLEYLADKIKQSTDAIIAAEKLIKELAK